MTLGKTVTEGATQQAGEQQEAENIHLNPNGHGTALIQIPPGYLTDNSETELHASRLEGLGPRELRQLLRLTDQINRGITLEEVLDFIYFELKESIPYSRLSLAMLSSDSNTVRATWVRSERPQHLKTDYEAPLQGSTLEQVARTGQPRILRDLQAFFEAHPESRSTRLLLDEGMRSSMTCPLIVRGKPVGFLFFNSDRPDIYRDSHVAFFQQIAGQLAVMVEKARLYSSLSRQIETIRRQHRQMIRELEMARTVQQNLMPSQAPPLPGLDIAFRWQPAQQIGGDLLDLVPLPDGRLFFFVGDAMGHGVQAALVISAIKTSLCSALQQTESPVEIAAILNRQVADVMRGRFVTAVLGRLDPISGRVELVLAGHPRPIVRRADPCGLAHPGKANLPLGVERDDPFQASEFVLEPNDVACFFTDGLFESGIEHGRPYGRPRLAEKILSAGSTTEPCAETLLEKVLQDFHAHLGHQPPPDDLALLVIRRKQG